MTLDEFRKAEAPPAKMSAPLLALWWDARGDWPRAHEAAQARPKRFMTRIRLFRLSV